jgi:hypothetical protein
MDSINLFLKIKKADIYLLYPYFEAFEGMVAIRTPRPEAGEYAKLKLMLSPDFVTDFEKVLENLKEKIWFERMVG